LIAWAGFRCHGTYERHASVDAGGGVGWIIGGGFVIPTVVLGIVFIAMLRSLTAFPIAHGTHHSAPQVRVIGHRWWWEIEYLLGSTAEHVKSDTELHIPAGQPIDIELISADVIHSFWVPALHGKVDMLPDTPTHIRIDARTAGTYGGACAEFCGTQHATMLFAVVAHPRQEFDRWLAREREDAVVPTDPEALAGQVLFNSKACALCHTIRGTSARGRVGPDLTHFGRRDLLDGPMPNNEAYLRAWVAHAQSLKPGVIMPSLLDLSGTELRALTAYLRQLQ
jgi:cytochrome c oxidase subunit 2